MSISDRKCIELLPGIVTYAATLLTMASLSCTQLFPVGKSRFTVRLGER